MEKGMFHIVKEVMMPVEGSFYFIFSLSHANELTAINIKRDKIKKMEISS